MINKIVSLNTVNYTEYFYLYKNNSYSSVPYTGLAYNSPNLNVYYSKKQSAGIGITLVSQSNGKPWISGGFVELDSVNLPGYYRLDIPNEVFASSYLTDITNLSISGIQDLFPVNITYQMEPSLSIASFGLYNRQLTANEILNNYNITRTRFDKIKTYTQLGTVGNPAPSGYVLAQQNPGLASGYYYIKNSNMPNALSMYVDMTNENGGYDYYPISNGISIPTIQDAHSGTPLGLDLVYPRSKQHWKSMYEFVVSILGSSVSTYLRTCGAVYNTNVGNYTSQILRNPLYYGTGATDWRVPDGGRWWLRDTTYVEPNGNYSVYSFLILQGLSSDGTITAFDDQGFIYTGASYLVSTNAKP